MMFPGVLRVGFPAHVLSSLGLPNPDATSLWQVHEGLGQLLLPCLIHTVGLRRRLRRFVHLFI